MGLEVDPEARASLLAASEAVLAAVREKVPAEAQYRANVEATFQHWVDKVRSHLPALVRQGGVPPFGTGLTRSGLSTHAPSGTGSTRSEALQHLLACERRFSACPGSDVCAASNEPSFAHPGCGCQLCCLGQPSPQQCPVSSVRNGDTFSEVTHNELQVKSSATDEELEEAL